MDAFLKLHPFPILYIADLDAILHRGNNLPLIKSLAERYPSTNFWIDAGIASVEDLHFWQGGWRLVIGSESQGSLSETQALLSANLLLPPILSLDFLGGRLQGPTELLERIELWPQEVIIMGLDQVGGNEGPEFARLEELRCRCPGKSFFAAGGVRHRDDLARLADLGITGALVASALHNGRIEFG